MDNEPIFVLEKRYDEENGDGGGWVLVKMEYMDGFSRDDTAPWPAKGWDRTELWGWMRKAKMDELLEEMQLADLRRLPCYSNGVKNPEISDELHDAIRYGIAPIEWQHDFDQPEGPGDRIWVLQK